MFTVLAGLVGFFLFLLGSCIGSFLLVIADRYISHENPFLGRSKCDYCNKQLVWYELIPYISFLIQRGRCSSCKKKLSAHYPLYEALCGVFAVVFLQQAVLLGQGIFLASAMFLVACVLLILIRIDLLLMLLPDGFIWVLIAVSCGIAGIAHAPFSDIAFGLLAGVGFLYVLWAGTGGAGIGFGDVKLMIPFGILFGFRGTVTLLFLAFFIGGIVGILLLSTKKAGAKTAIPFGPFLAIAAFAIMLIPDLPHRFFQLLGVE
ncbi:MAG: prepilin peptidase [Candidatus Andersenbacteria bacterium]|nr:prepilin peptidase [Candidatus Andersenbacteria bacterium]